MNAAEVEKSHIERHTSPQVPELLAKAQAQAREAAQMRSHAQIGSLDVASGNVARVRIPAERCGERVAGRISNTQLAHYRKSPCLDVANGPQ